MIAVLMEIGPGRCLLARSVGAAANSLLAWTLQRVGQALAALEPFPRGVPLMELGHA